MSSKYLASCFLALLFLLQSFASAQHRPKKSQNDSDMATAEPAKITEGVKAVMKGKEIVLNRATLERGSDGWVLTMSNEWDTSRPCRFQIDVFDSPNIKGYFSEDVKELSVGLELVRKDNGLGGTKNLTLGYSLPNLTPVTALDARVKILKINGSEVELEVESPYSKSFGGYGAKGVVKAVICDK